MCTKVSKTPRWLLILLAICVIVLMAAILLLVLAALKPCYFTKCHPRASNCINRALFKAQCICDVGTAGNGRSVCDDCGLTYEPVNPRIIGGANVFDHRWPFAVLIRQRYKSSIILKAKSYTISSSWICGGTLINHRTILTAAHCLKTAGDTFDFQSLAFPIAWNKYYPTIESTLEVSIGMQDRRKQAETRLVNVQQVIRHPSFDQRSLLDDIAILKLDDYLRPSPAIQFACLTDSLPVQNLWGTVVGFGDTSPGANQGSLILQQVNLTIYPDDVCSNVSPSTRKNWTVQLCCGDLAGQRDACQGDSGGGLFIARNMSNSLRYTVDGIVSYGEQCASSMKAGIYTRIAAYVDWIQRNSDFDAIEAAV